MFKATQQLAIETSLKQKRNPYAAQQTIRKELLSTLKYHNGCLQDQAGKEKQATHQKYYQMPLITANRIV